MGGGNARGGEKKQPPVGLPRGGGSWYNGGNDMKKEFPHEKDCKCKESGVLRAVHRAVRGAADGVPRDRERRDDLPADAHSCAAVRTGVRVAVWADLRRARAAAVRRADGNAWAGGAARDDGRMRRVRARMRADDAARAHGQAVCRPLHQPDHSDAAGPGALRRVQGASVRAGDVLDRRVGNGIVCDGSAGHHHPARAAALARGGADEGAVAARPVRIR